MWLGKLVRGYLLMAAGQLLSPAPRQEVLNASLPSVCTSPIVIPHLNDIPTGAWRNAFDTSAASPIIDISIPLHTGTVDWERCAEVVTDGQAHLATPCDTLRHSATGLEPSFRSLDASQQLGDRFTASSLHMSAHTGVSCAMLAARTPPSGTHIDSPGHFVWEAYASGQGMESLSLDILNGAWMRQVGAHIGVAQDRHSCSS